MTLRGLSLSLSLGSALVVFLCCASSVSAQTPTPRVTATATPTPTWVKPRVECNKSENIFYQVWKDLNIHSFYSWTCAVETEGEVCKDSYAEYQGFLALRKCMKQYVDALETEFKLKETQGRKSCLTTILANSNIPENIEDFYSCEGCPKFSEGCEREDKLSHIMSGIVSENFGLTIIPASRIIEATIPCGNNSVLRVKRYRVEYSCTAKKGETYAVRVGCKDCFLQVEGQRIACNNYNSLSPEMKTKFNQEVGKQCATTNEPEACASRYAKLVAVSQPTPTVVATPGR